MWIEPGSEDFDQVVGINFLGAMKEPGAVAYNKEVSFIRGAGRVPRGLTPRVKAVRSGECSTVDVDEHTPRSLAAAGLGTFLTLGRHVTAYEGSSVTRDSPPLPTRDSLRDAESDAQHAHREPLFEGHTITHPTDHDAYDEFTQHRAVKQFDDTKSDSDRPDLKSGSNSNRNEFYQQTITALTGRDVGERGPNPLSHVGDSENYFIPLSPDVAYDHKRKVAYTPLSYMACIVKVRRIDDPEGEFSDEEQLHTWVRIKERTTILSDDAQIPWKLLNEAGLELGTLEPEEIQETEVSVGDKTITVDKIVNDQKFNATIDAFREEYGVDPGRSKKINRSMLKDEGVTTEDSITRFAQYHMTDGIEFDDKRADHVPKVETKKVFVAYEEYCAINGIEPSQDNRKKARLVDEVNAEKQRFQLDGERASRIVGSELTATGEVLAQQGGWGERSE